MKSKNPVRCPIHLFHSFIVNIFKVGPFDTDDNVEKSVFIDWYSPLPFYDENGLLSIGFTR